MGTTTWFTPGGGWRLMYVNGLQLLPQSGNDRPWYPVYLFAIAIRQPGKWAHHCPTPYA